MADLKDVPDTKASSLADPPNSSSGSGEKPITNVDAAWKFIDANRGIDGVDATDVELRRLRRKIDWHIVPIMFCCYTMQFLDKVILNVSGPKTPCISRRHPTFWSGSALGRGRGLGAAGDRFRAGPVTLTCRSHSMLPSWASPRN